MDEGVKDACIKIVTAKSLVNCRDNAVNKNALDSAHETSLKNLFTNSRHLNLIKSLQNDYFYKFESSSPVDPLKFDASLGDSIDIDDDFKMSIQSLTNFESEVTEVNDDHLGTQTPSKPTPSSPKRRGRPRRNIRTINTPNTVNDEDNVNEVPTTRKRKPTIKFAPRSKKNAKVVNKSFVKQTTLNDKAIVEDVPTKRNRKPNSKFAVENATNTKVVKKKSIKGKTLISTKIQAQTKNNKTNLIVIRKEEPPLWAGGPSRSYSNSYEKVTIYCPEEKKKLKLTDTMYIRGEPKACRKCGTRLRFICSCGKEFKARRSFQYHVRWECGKYQSYGCEHCSLTFYFKKTLEKHILEHTQLIKDRPQSGRNPTHQKFTRYLPKKS